jgi:hypothetical protein
MGKAIPMGKSRPDSKPYLTIVEGSWKTLVLKAYSEDPDAPYARWFCKVITPMTGEWGDTYIAEIPGEIVQRDPEVPESALPRRFRAAITLSPFVQRALAGALPAKEIK